MDSLSPRQIKRIFNSGLTKNEQIVELLELDFSRRDIMTMVSCSPNRITRVRASMKIGGSPPSEAKMGRPTKKTNDVAAFIRQATFNDPYISGSDLHTQIDQTMHTSISSSTINEFRREIRFKYLPPLHEPSLTNIQIQKRINFCYSILLRRKELPFICFSDESRFSLGSDKRYLWRMRGKYNPKTVVHKVKFPTTIMIWGMIGINYKSSLFIFDETENFQNYTEMLDEKCFLLDALTFYENDFAFQQDGAPSHTSHYTMDTLSKICDILINWPPNSPDLNCIEMMWSLMDDQIAFYHPTNREELIEAVKLAWNNIKMETVNKLCGSFLRRCFLCLKNRGGCINQLLQKNIDHNVTDKEIDELFNKLRKDGIQLNEIEILKKKIE